jgi:hypothetical protein
VQREIVGGGIRLTTATWLLTHIDGDQKPWIDRRRLFVKKTGLASGPVASDEIEGKRKKSKGNEEGVLYQRVLNSGSPRLNMEA